MSDSGKSRSHYGIGVVGVGVWGCHTLEQAVLKAGNASISAICAADEFGANCHGNELPVRTRQYAAEHNADLIHDWRDLIAREDVDIVSAMVCPRKKAEVIMAALQAGKHVVTDKPLAFSSAEAAALQQAELISPGKGFMLAGYQERPLVKHLIQNIRNGRLGNLKAVSIRICFMGGIFPGFEPTAEWRREIPSAEMTTIGSHAVMTLLKMTDAQVTHLYAIQKNDFFDAYERIDAEDYADINLQFDTGMVGSITVGRLSYRIPDEDILLEVTGDEGYAEIRGNRLVYFPDQEEVEIPSDSMATLHNMFKTYMSNLESKAPAPVSFTDGFRLQRLLDAAIQSSRSNSVVATSELMP